MSKYNKTILTNAGLDLAARASSGKTKFTITRAATSTEKLADKSISELQQLTALPSLMQYGEINNIAGSSQDKSIVIGTELVFNNKDLTTGYNVNAIGLFAKKEGASKEILYALTTAVEPEMMPDFKDKVLFKFNMTMFVVVGQNDNVTVNVNQNGVVTQQQLSGIVAKLPTKEDLAKVRKDSNALAVLSNPDSIVANQTINLDTFTVKGITKFQNAQLSSAGYMQAFDQSTTGLNGWIFNVYSNDGASYIQIVHITNTTYNQGAMYFLRAKANGSSTEDFARMSTVKDHAQFFSLTEKDAKEVVARDENKSFNPDNVVDSGVHRISSTKINAKYDVTDTKDANSGYSFSGFYWGWLFNLNFDDSQNSNAVYQLLVVNSGIYYREISVKTNDFPAFNSFSFTKDIASLQTAIDNKLKAKVNFSDLIGYISDHNGNHLAETTGDANAIGDPGIYFTKGNIKNLPLTNWGILQVIGITATDSDNAHRKIQIYYPDGLNIMPYYRNVTNTTISAWHQLASTDDITNLINRINTLGKVQKVNNQWPGLDGNVNINTADNITILPDNSSLNDVINPGFYRGNNLKDGPHTNVNDVFAVYGQKYAGSAITQVVYRAIHFNNTSRNYTRIYTRMGYFDETLNVLWGDWNSNVANIHINNNDPDNNGNVNINTLDNPTMLAYGTSLNNVIKPGFYRANACKDGPITDSIYNDVFCVIGVYQPGTVLTQFLPIAYYSTPDYSNNHTDLYLRTAYLDNNLIAHWGAYHKISTPLA